MTIFFQVIGTDKNSMERNHRSMLLAVIIRWNHFDLGHSDFTLQSALVKKRLFGPDLFYDTFTAGCDCPGWTDQQAQMTPDAF